MKKFIKNNLKVITSFIIGILVSSIGVYAVNSIFAKDITYTNIKNNNITNVKDALDDLYNQRKKMTLLSENLSFDLTKGTTKTIDVSNYNNYESFNEDNFIVEASGYSAAASTENATTFTYTVYLSKSYDKEKGILTITAPKECYKGHTVHLFTNIYLIN